MAKQKKISAMTSKKRLVFFFSVIIIMFVVLALRLGQIQIIKADDYSSQALRQQTRDVPITAKRGNIYDTNNKPLAINQSMSTVWVRPSEVKAAEKEKSGYAREMASVLSDILGDMTEDEVYEIITGDTSLPSEDGRYPPGDEFPRCGSSPSQKSPPPSPLPCEMR